MENVVNFVTDCGGDPTGVSDSAAALGVAYEKLSALSQNSPGVVANSAVLDVPPGNYRIASSTGPVWNFYHRTSSVRIRGYQDASVFICDAITNQNLITIGDANKCIIEGLTVIGAGGGVNKDISAVFQTNNAQTIIRDCRFNYLISDAILVDQFKLLVENCEFSQSAQRLNGFAVVYSMGGLALSIHNCVFEDLAPTNGFDDPISKVVTNKVWVKFDAGDIQYTRQGLDIRKCLFDEGCGVAVWTTGALQSAIVEQCSFNCPIHTSAVPVSAWMLFDGTMDVLVRGVTGQTWTPDPDIPAIALRSVRRAKIDGTYLDQANTAKYITTDAETKYLQVEASGFALQDIRADPGTTVSIDAM